MTQSEIKAPPFGRAQNLLNGLCAHRNAFTVGWCAAFVQCGFIHVVQRAELRS